MVEGVVLEDMETGKVERQCYYFKPKMLENLKADGTDQTFKNVIGQEQNTIFTHQSSYYVNIADFVEIHNSEKSNETATKEILKWVYIAISNAKRNFVGNYHKIKRKYLQLYLNELVCKLNRRYFGEQICDRLVITEV